MTFYISNRFPLICEERLVKNLAKWNKQLWNLADVYLCCCFTWSKYRKWLKLKIHDYVLPMEKKTDFGSEIVIHLFKIRVWIRGNNATKFQKMLLPFFMAYSLPTPFIFSAFLLFFIICALIFIFHSCSSLNHIRKPSLHKRSVTVWVWILDQ